MQITDSFILINGEYRTHPHVFNMGMCACSDCGQLNSVDTDKCKRCFEKLVIIIDEKHKQLEHVK